MAGAHLFSFSVLADSLLRHCSPWSQAGTHAGHDHGFGGLLRQYDGALPHCTHHGGAWFLLSHVACAFTQSKLLGGLHCPVNQYHAELDLVRMHQRRAGNGVAPGFQHRHHLQQVLNGRSGACKLLQHICMVCKVLGQVAIEGGSLLAVLDNALQLLLFTLILCKERKSLVELSVRLSENIKHMGEKLSHTQLCRAPVAGSVQRKDSQVLRRVKAHHLTEFQDLVLWVARPDGQTFTSLVRYVGALDLKFIVTNVSIILGITSQHVVREQSESVGTRWDDVVVTHRWLSQSTWRGINSVGWGWNVLAQWKGWGSEDLPKLWQPGFPSSVVAILITVVSHTALEHALTTKLTQARIKACCSHTELAVG
mmetsp:Transcript_23438/g.48668  ORF Transcript_23438/g.48668 Transcript_23438/m.48668 type:complete len:367 (-) Transcript_23438:232-1332(-)